MTHLAKKSRGQSFQGTVASWQIQLGVCEGVLVHGIQGTESEHTTFVPHCGQALRNLVAQMIAPPTQKQEVCITKTRYIVYLSNFSSIPDTVSKKMAYN